MPIKYKIDMLAALKDAGYNTTRLRREKLLSESTIQALRIGKMVSLENISRICSMLQCQPGDILEYSES
jgi:putative transcriptional regulator|uniref:helix-turn-helix domain-containing protein n=1 Tax=Dysosmobacter welbionis TaxID=2093857 RepID=UPI003FF0A42A